MILRLITLMMVFYVAGNSFSGTCSSGDKKKHVLFLLDESGDLLSPLSVKKDCSVGRLKDLCRSHFFIGSESDIKIYAQTKSKKGFKVGSSHFLLLKNNTTSLESIGAFEQTQLVMLLVANTGDYLGRQTIKKPLDVNS